ncbi:MAG TPA: hypothetical protein PK059_05440 [Cyclobacteriaceae bacterium]|nr:hypothetical protein [Cyclobacteriaceae bacterium]
MENNEHTVELLPINSFEVEEQLSEFGISLLNFSKIYDFSKRFAGVSDCDFIQSIIVEFTSELKIDLIAYLGISTLDLKAGDRIKILENELPSMVVREAVLNAHEKGILVRHHPNSLWFSFTLGFAFSLEFLRKIGFSLKEWIKDSKIERQIIPKVNGDEFRLLLSTYQSNTIYTLTPVQDRLRQRIDVKQVYLANRFETYQLLKSKGYENLIYAWKLRSPKLAVDFDVFQDFVNSYFEKAFPFGKATSRFKSQFVSKLRKKLSFAIRLYSPIKEVIEVYKPNAILVSSCSTVDAQIMIHLAKYMHIKVLEMTHGMFQDSPLLKFQHVPVKLVWSERQRDIMLKYTTNMVCPVIGNPKHDELLSAFEKSPPVRLFAGPYVLFASTPGNNISISKITYLKILGEYVTVASRFPDLLFVWKLHPSESKQRISEELKAMSPPNNLIIEQGSDVYGLIYHAEMVIVITSTVGFEALLWKKKLICYSIRNSEKWLPFSEHGLAKSASNTDDLIGAIDFFLSNNSLAADNPKRNYFAFSDGMALDRIVKMVLQKEV